jgi:phosphomannomutase
MSPTAAPAGVVPAIDLAPEVLAGLGAEVAGALTQWASDPRYADDRAVLAELVARVRAGDDGARAELEDSFSGPLPIGTGGRRGAVGAGPNRMNLTLVRETAQGLADLVHAEGVSREVAICYDTRTHSQRFAHAVADQLAACELDVLLVEAPRPTPQLAYLVRTRGCAAGVVISASHNPPGDNGIKVYGPDGAQVLGARDRALMEAIRRAMHQPLRAAGPRRGRVEIVGDPAAIAELDAPYHDFVLAQGVLDEVPPGLQVVFTPLHGVGHTAVMPVLARKRIDTQIVQAQLPDDGRFGTVASANPESPESLTLAIAQAEASDADLVIATDPDADRLGVAARTRGGGIEFIDGNRTGVLMLDHVLRHASLPARGWVLSTIVTTPLIATLARAAGVEVVDDLLVGFKHHAGMLDEQPDRPLVFATEESHGYLRGNDVHDKDGAIASLLMAECAALAKAQGRTLDDELDRVFMAHGYHRERTANLYAYGASGREAIAKLMSSWREAPPASFGGLAVVSIEDRMRPRSTGSATRDLTSNVLLFELAAPGGLGCRLVVRPSGTEPKAKLYALGRGPASADARGLARVRAEVDELVDRVLDEARALAEVVMGGGG